ncbi:MAG: hypothetical protein QOK42_873, partial [Frankiaceae bacterium]|nr:hypothetical protein [Frankiaceae bacterium]
GSSSRSASRPILIDIHPPAVTVYWVCILGMFAGVKRLTDRGRQTWLVTNPSMSTGPVPRARIETLAVRSEKVGRAITAR